MIVNYGTTTLLVTTRGPRHCTAADDRERCCTSRNKIVKECPILHLYHCELCGPLLNKQHLTNYRRATTFLHI